MDQYFVTQIQSVPVARPQGQCLAEPLAIAILDSGSPGVVVPPAQTYGGLGGSGTL